MVIQCEWFQSPVQIYRQTMNLFTHHSRFHFMKAFFPPVVAIFARLARSESYSSKLYRKSRRSRACFRATPLRFAQLSRTMKISSTTSRDSLRFLIATLKLARVIFRGWLARPRRRLAIVSARYSRDFTKFNVVAFMCVRRFVDSWRDHLLAVPSFNHSPTKAQHNEHRRRATAQSSREEKAGRGEGRRRRTLQGGSRWQRQGSRGESADVKREFKEEKGAREC